MIRMTGWPLLATLLFAPYANALTVQYDSHDFPAWLYFSGHERPIDHMRVVVDWDNYMITELSIVSDWVSAHLITPESFKGEGQVAHDGHGWTVNLWSSTFYVLLTDHASGMEYVARAMPDWTTHGHATLEEALNGHTIAFGIAWNDTGFEVRPTGAVAILDAVPVPEPSPLALFGLGLAAFGLKRRKS